MIRPTHKPIFTYPTKTAGVYRSLFEDVFKDQVRSCGDRTLSLAISPIRNRLKSDSDKLYLRLNNVKLVDLQLSEIPHVAYDCGEFSMIASDVLSDYIPMLPPNELVCSQFLKDGGTHCSIAAIQTLCAIIIDQKVFKSDLLTLEFAPTLVDDLIGLIGIYYQDVRHLGVGISIQPDGNSGNHRSFLEFVGPIGARL